jgi:FAD binding domain.
MSNADPASPATNEHEILDSVKTTCCIVGAGPGGAVLALVLARQGEYR